LLDRLGVAAYKVASTDTTNVPFLRHLASKGRAVILSTGLSTLEEVETAVESLASIRDRLALLHCTSEYPAPPEESNLRAMATLRRAFAVPVGFSDHTAGIGLSPMAVAAGAALIEKHMTLDRTLPGPDHRASVEPQEMAELVKQVRWVETALGDGGKRPMPSEIGNKARMQKSLVARRAITAGQTIGPEDLTCKRPATGLSPALWDKVIGQKAAIDLPADTVLQMSSVAWSGRP
jgi:sialic acid synthase SpsE